MVDPRRSTGRRLAWIGAALAMTSAALAQPLPNPEQAEDLAVRALSRDILADFKLARPPTERDYRIAAELLEICHSLAPQQEIILRWLIEATTGANRTDRAIELTRTLASIDPADTVAQLRLISGQIARFQSVEERVAAYDRFLGGRGESIDAAVRSRLALDAALLERERGDLDRFADRLNLALDLDPTNKDAAALALAFFSSRITDPVGRVDLLLNVLYADPFDAQVHMSIAQLLASNWAFKGAERFLRTFAKLRDLSGRQPDAEEQAFRDAVDWNQRGASALVRRLTDTLDDQRLEVNRRRQAAARGVGEELPDPNDVRLPFSSERTRLLAATAAGNTEIAATSIVELAETARRMAQQLADPVARPREIPEDEVRPRIQQILGEMVWLRLWSGQQLPDAERGLSVLKRGQDLETAYLDRLDAWILLRKGDLSGADAALRALALTDPHAELGLAVLAEQTGDRRQAVLSYMALARAFGADLLGAFARTRAAVLVGAELPKGEVGERLETVASGVPDWLESMIDQPHRVQFVEATIENLDVRVLERTPVRIAVTNVAPIPLAFGPDKPISSRFLLAPIAEVLAQPTASMELAEVVSLDRRLRLMPRERFETVVWGDAGQLGMLLDLSATGNSRVRWRVLQGFEYAPNRIYDAGPHSVTADTEMLVRRPAAKFVAEPTALAGWLDSGGPRQIGETILTMRARQARTTEVAPLSHEDLNRLMETLAGRFNRLDKATKILVQALLPTAQVQPEVVTVDNAARRDSDADVLAVQMALRTIDPADPIFTLPLVTAEPRLASLAADVQSRLRTTARTYATQESDVRPAIPPLIGPPRPGGPAK